MESHHGQYSTRVSISSTSRVCLFRACSSELLIAYDNIYNVGHFFSFSLFYCVRVGRNFFVFVEKGLAFIYNIVLVEVTVNVSDNDWSFMAVRLLLS